MISFVCWLWRTSDRERVFKPQHVNVLRSMVARNYPHPHRFICITDDAKGLASGIEVVPLPATFAHLMSPSGPRYPSCYRRLWNFSREAAAVLGERIFALDVDAVIVRDLTPLTLHAENFVGWCDERFGWKKIAGGAYMLRTGTMSHVWDDFDPERSPAQAFSAGNGGSDQGWMSFKMYPPLAYWNRADGLVKLKWTKPSSVAPKDVRIAFTSGVAPPWSPEVQRRYPWVREHWR